MRIETVAAAIRLGKEAGCRVILDPAPVQTTIPNLWREPDVVSPNETEALALVPGADTSSVAGALACADRIREAGVGYVALKLGDRGCVISGPEGRTHVPAFAVAAVDTTAAGDAFTAGLAVALCEGLGQNQAGSFANACGALAATEYGAQPSLPMRARVQELLARGLT
jgi:ribokinase